METNGCTSDLKDIEEFEKKPDSFVNSDNSEGEEDYDDEDDFTFACAGDDDDDATSFSAEDMFDNGKIRPVFPLFDQSLVFMPPVKNIFLETCGAPPPMTEAAAVEQLTGEEAGSYCSWSRKAVQVGPASSPDSCKKSNSTGFSKIWRFKEMSNRSHSDGRDAFVFLNKTTPEKKPKDSAAAAAADSSNGSRGSLGFLDKLALEKKSKDSVATARRKTSGSDDRESKDSAAAAARGKKTSGSSGRDTVGAGGERERAAAAMAAKKKGGGKGKKVASAHEVYVKSRAATREEDRRRSYLPYKPELVGFFTNAHGGMSKNVHPF